MNERLLREVTERTEAARLPIAELLGLMRDGQGHEPDAIISALATCLVELSLEMLRHHDFVTLLEVMHATFDNAATVLPHHGEMN